MAEDNTPAVGIDLGTTFSCVAVFQNGKPKVLANDNGNRITPSYVAFTDNGHLVGEEARYRMSLQPTRTVYQVKRLMGRTFDDPIIQEDISRWPFDVCEQDGKPVIKVLSDGKLQFFTPEEISSKILLKMKEIAENYLKQKITKAVITVPAYFNDSQRQATKTAAKLADLEVLRIINEPTAAAIAYGFKRRLNSEQRILMFDLGGGTFDVSILLVDEGILQVLATGGDTHLGGTDFDNRMTDKLINYFNKKFDPHDDVTTGARNRNKHRLARAIEFAKCQLSNEEKAQINIDAFHEDKDFVYDMYRDEFNEVNQDLFSKTIDHVENVLKDANLTKDEIDEVILVGGSTRILLVQKLLEDFFPGKKLNKSINPDEAVACGAAVEAAILLGKSAVDEILLMDVTPLTLGVEIKGGLMMNIIDRNTLIPAKGVREGTTVRDNQPKVDLVVFQGERPIARDNHFLGEFVLDGIEKAPAGVPKIDVTFELDMDGILAVTAEDKITHAKRSISITHNKAKMSEHDIARALEEAEEHRSEDSREREKILARNSLDVTVQWLLYLMKNIKEELNFSDKYRSELISKCNEVVQWMNNNVNASTDEYKWQIGILEDICRDIPPEYKTPGHLPGGKRLREYDNPLTVSYNDENYDDDEVGEID